MRGSRGRGETLALEQGLYYAATGVWPLLHMRSFERVSGPKVDDWLVKTFGALLGVVGATLALAGARRALTPELRLLALGSAAVLGTADVVYAAGGRIRRVYLLDALVEAGLVVERLRAAGR